MTFTSTAAFESLSAPVKQRLGAIKKKYPGHVVLLQSAGQARAFGHDAERIADATGKAVSPAGDVILSTDELQAKMHHIIRAGILLALA